MYRKFTMQFFLVKKKIYFIILVSWDNKNRLILQTLFSQIPSAARSERLAPWPQVRFNILRDSAWDKTSSGSPGWATWRELKLISVFNWSGCSDCSNYYYGGSDWIFSSFLLHSNLLNTFIISFNRQIVDSSIATLHSTLWLVECRHASLRHFYN